MRFFSSGFSISSNLEFKRKIYQKYGLIIGLKIGDFRINMEYCTKLHFPYLFHGKGGFPPEELPYHVHRRWWRHRDITNHGMQSGHVLNSRKMGAQLCTGDFGQFLHLFIAKKSFKIYESQRNHEITIMKI